VLTTQGNLTEALKNYQGSLAIRDRLAQADFNNANRQRDLAISQVALPSSWPNRRRTTRDR
jgi:hypothetical protein